MDSGTIQEKLEAMHDFLSAAMLNPQVRPDQEKVDELTEELLGELYNRYGEDVEILAEPYASGVDKEKICELSMAMYTEILSMPEQDSGPLLRSLMSSEQ